MVVRRDGEVVEELATAAASMMEIVDSMADWMVWVSSMNHAPTCTHRCVCSVGSY